MRDCNLIGHPNIPGWGTKTCRECPPPPTSHPRMRARRKIRLARETRVSHIILPEYNIYALRLSLDFDSKKPSFQKLWREKAICK